jgi:hypothetical protein
MMPEYIFLMHGDAVATEASWEPYLRKLQASGAFAGGSAIGDGEIRELPRTDE